MPYFAVQRGNIKHSSLSYSPYAPLLVRLLETWMKSDWDRGQLSEWVAINPTTEISFLSDNDTVSFVPMEAVGKKNGEIELQKAMFSSVAQGYTRFAEGDLIWAKITPCMQNGKAAVARGLRQGIGFGSTEFHVLRPKTGEVLVEFLWVLLTLDSFLIAAQATFSGTAGQQRVPESFLNSLPAPIPPLNIQRQIVAHMEAARESRKAKLAQADALLASIDDYVLEQLEITLPSQDNHQAFTASLKGSGGRIDAHFHQPRFLQLTDVVRKMPHARLDDLVQFSNENWNPDDSDEDTFYYIEISGIDIRTGEFAPTGVQVAEAPSRARMVVRQDDIIVSLTRPQRGAIAIISGQFDQCIASTGFAVLRRIKDEKLNREYLWCVLRSKLCLNQMLQRSSGGNYPAIIQSELGQILIPIPPLDVQETMVAEVHQRHREARRLRDEAEAEWTAAKTWFEQQLLGDDA